MVTPRSDDSAALGLESRVEARGRPLTNGWVESAGPAGLPLLADAVLLQLPIKSPLADAQHARGFLAVAEGELEGFGDVVFFDLFQRLADQVVNGAGLVAGHGGGGGLEVLSQVVDVEHTVGVDHDHALDDVLEFADV